MLRPPLLPTLFPYTTLFRSINGSIDYYNIKLDNTVSGISAQRVVDCLERSEEHTSELQSRGHLVCRLLLEKKKQLYQNSQLVRANVRMPPPNPRQTTPHNRR